MKIVPDYLDALYLATKSGPNVAYIKHYWKNVEDIANTTRHRQSSQVVKDMEKDVNKLTRKLTDVTISLAKETTSEEEKKNCLIKLPKY